MSNAANLIGQEFQTPTQIESLNVEFLPEAKKQQNLSVWNYASETDPSQTTELTGVGYSGTGINAYWMIKKATEMWGPIGDNWGYDILEDRFDQGGPIFAPDKITILCSAIVHTIKINLWYMKGEKKCTVTEYGHTKFVYQTKYGSKTEDDPAKKSLTDALKKALSLCGICSDIYSGKYDNPNYKASITAEYDAEKEEQIQIEQDQKIRELVDLIAKTQNDIKSAETQSQINEYCKPALRTLKAQQKIHLLKEIATRGILAITKDGAAYKKAIFENQKQTEA